MVDSYLPAEVKVHTIQVQLKSSDMDHFKRVVRSALRHVEAGYRTVFQIYLQRFQGQIDSRFRTHTGGRGLKS